MGKRPRDCIQTGGLLSSKGNRLKKENHDNRHDCQHDSPKQKGLFQRSLGFFLFPPFFWTDTLEEKGDHGSEVDANNIQDKKQKGTDTVFKITG